MLTYDINYEVFTLGYAQALQLGESVRFDLTGNDVNYLMALKAVRSDSIRVEFIRELGPEQSVAFDLALGQDQNVNADFDADDDLTVTLNNIKRGVANITIKRIGLPTTAQSIPQTEGGRAVEGEGYTIVNIMVPPLPGTGEPGEFPREALGILIGVAVVVLLLGVLFGFIGRKKKKGMDLYT